MTIDEKITCAIKYVREHIDELGGNVSEIKNDAANIFADDYEEYLAVWRALDI